MPYVCEGWNQGRRMSESAAFIIFGGSLTGGAAGGAPCRVAKPEGEGLTYKAAAAEDERSNRLPDGEIGGLRSETPAGAP